MRSSARSSFSWQSFVRAMLPRISRSASPADSPASISRTRASRRSRAPSNVGVCLGCAHGSVSRSTSGRGRSKGRPCRRWEVDHGLEGQRLERLLLSQDEPAPLLVGAKDDFTEELRIPGDGREIKAANGLAHHVVIADLHHRLRRVGRSRHLRFAYQATAHGMSAQSASLSSYQVPSWAI